MGGIGSGRRRVGSAYREVDEFFSLDIRELVENLELLPEHPFFWDWVRGSSLAARALIGGNRNQIRLDLNPYRNEKEAGSLNLIDISWTPCHFGGERPWFLCPNYICRRRVAILYGLSFFRCRDCANLKYPSQREDMGDRALRKAEKINEKLGWPPGFLNDFGFKPKGMHWDTFARLVNTRNKLKEMHLSELVRKFNM